MAPTFWKLLLDADNPTLEDFAREDNRILDRLSHLKEETASKKEKWVWKDWESVDQQLDKLEKSQDIEFDKDEANKYKVDNDASEEENQYATNEKTTKYGNIDTTMRQNWLA